VSIKLSLLFELCLVVKAKPNSSAAQTPISPSLVAGKNGMAVLFQQKQLEEISCGWCMLPLYTIDGNPLEAKSYEMVLFGGTPYDQDVELAPSPTRKSFLSIFSGGNKQPRLTVKIWNMKTKMKKSIQ
jgi:hypothetical protein